MTGHEHSTTRSGECVGEGVGEGVDEGVGARELACSFPESVHTGTLCTVRIFDPKLGNMNTWPSKRLDSIHTVHTVLEHQPWEKTLARPWRSTRVFRHIIEIFGQEYLVRGVICEQT
jgi:hypothetical protein